MGIKTYKNKKTKVSFIKKSDVKKIFAEHDFEKKLRENDGGGDLVDKAEKVANKGNWLERYVKIAEEVKGEWAEELAQLEAIHKKMGALPDGLRELAGELITSVAFDLVDDQNWNKLDIERIAWGLPIDWLRMYKIVRPTSDYTNKADN